MSKYGSEFSPRSSFVDERKAGAEGFTAVNVKNSGAPLCLDSTT
jgi:hypothetical protein